MASIGHDLHGVTRLDSADEVQRYLSDPNYAGRHNRGVDSVNHAAKSLGWIDE